MALPDLTKLTDSTTGKITAASLTAALTAIILWVTTTMQPMITPSAPLPAANISGLAPSATIDATSAANIVSGTLSADRLPPVFAGYAPVILIWGESNASGQAPLTSLTTAQLAVRSHVWIVNNTTLAVERLQIGANNNIDTGGSNGVANNTTHGMELAIADQFESGAFGASAADIYIVKATQGGSTLYDWREGGTYWTKLLAGVGAMKTALAGQGKKPAWFVFASQGINDKGWGTDPLSWRDGALAIQARIRAAIGAHAPVYWTKFGSNYAGVNAQLDAIAGGIDRATTAIDTSGKTLMADGLHWDSAGIAAIGHDMIARAVADYGASAASYVMARDAADGAQAAMARAPTAPPTISLASGEYSVAQTVTLTSVDATASIFYTLDGSDPTPASMLYAGPIAVTGNTTIKAIASAPRRASSAIVGATYALAPQPTVAVDWAQLVNASLSGGVLTATGAAAKAVATKQIDPRRPFRIVVPWTSSGVDAAVVALDTDATPLPNLFVAHPVVAGFHTSGGYAYWDANTSLDTAGWQSGQALNYSFAYGASVAGSLTKSGDDVLFQTTADGGATWTTRHVFVGALRGRTSLTVKAHINTSGGAIGATIAASQPMATHVNPQAKTMPPGSFAAFLRSDAVDRLIYYTTDGSTPSTSSSAYTGPLTVSATATIKTLVQTPGYPDAYGQHYFYVQTANPATWGTLTNATASGSTMTSASSGSPAGGVAGPAIDATKDFVVTIPIPSSTVSDGAVVYLDTSNAAVTAWGAAHPVIAEAHVSSGYLYSYSDLAGSGTYGGSVGALAAGANTSIRLRKSGLDIVLDSTTDAGATWTARKTFAGALIGLTTIYLKGLFASVSASKQITATIIQ